MLFYLFAYIAAIFLVSHFATKHTTSGSFFRGDRRSPWMMVAFGMVGASVSGVTFVSVPGMVMHSGMTYLQTCMGFIVGYFIVAFVLLPIYYRMNLTSIYSYLQCISDGAYKTGATFFILSKLLGSAAKFYVPCFMISHTMQWDFSLTVCLMLLCIWLYTRRGGIKTLVWTDTLQTTCMLACLIFIIYHVYTSLTEGAEAMTMGEVAREVWQSDYSRVFDFTDFSSPANFFKCFVAGVFIVIVMTGLDQDMMQKNLTCRTLHDAQKDMCTYGFAFLPVNALFLLLGVLLTIYYSRHGLPLPERADDLLQPLLADPATQVLFIVGVLATSLSTVDSAMTALTTSICIDIMHKDKEDGKATVRKVHMTVALAVAICCILFDRLNTTSLIDAVYTLVSYTYGPLLGLFAYAMTLGGKQGHCMQRPFAVPLAVCLASPALCYALSVIIPMFTGYRFGYELLLVNGTITFAGIWLTHRKRKNV